MEILMPEQVRALSWITSLLIEKKIQFQVTGGLAARLYGSTRPLFDIDIDVEAGALERILPCVRDYVVYGPETYRDECFDIKLMTLDYHGQGIDLSVSDGAKLYDKRKGTWQSGKTDFLSSEKILINELLVPVIPREDLLEYKMMIARSMDVEDIRSILSR